MKILSLMALLLMVGSSFAQGPVSTVTELKSALERNAGKKIILNVGESTLPLYVQATYLVKWIVAENDPQKEYEVIDVYVTADENDELVNYLNVRVEPTYIFYKSGVETGRYFGSPSGSSNYEKFVQKLK